MKLPRNQPRNMTPTLLLTSLLLLQGSAELVVGKDYLLECCSLGSLWAGQKLRCEQFTSPVLGLPAQNQSICLEAIGACCRKTYRDEACTQGKFDAWTEVACPVVGEGSDDPLEHRRDCCEACKLGILTGKIGKGCSSENFSLDASKEPAFMNCCNKAMTNFTKSSLETIITVSESPVTTITGDKMQESKDMDNGIDEITDKNSSTDFKTDNLCQLMRGMLCSEICVTTPGSYYCQCYEGSILEEDGRSCKSNLTAEKQMNAPTKNSSTLNSMIPSSNLTNSTEDIGLSFKSSTAGVASSLNNSLPSDAIKKKSTWSMSSESSFKLFTIDAKPRTTRSAPTEDNELNLPCPAGYRFISSTETCDDIDECSEQSTSICPPGTNCVNVNGSYQCLQVVQRSSTGEPCKLGYRWNSTLDRCLDIDECLENIHKCLVDEENCRNLEGSYECEIKCENGFVFNGNYGACLDINECIEFSNTCLQPDTICVNTLGGFECKNLNEYQHYDDSNIAGNGTGDGRTSDYEGFDEGGNIDECQVREQACALGEICINTIGGYDCVPEGCPKGFVLASDLCQDVDECEQGLHSCEAHERCQNTNGSFTCEQPRSTFRTVATNPIASLCRKGYKVYNDSGICVDIDECVEGPGCRDHERCRNLEGSYDCSPLCGPGWYFQLQTKTCQDVDECLLGHHNCRQRTQFCRNTNGSYICEALIACSTGYRRDQNGSCIDVDECLEGVHTCSRDSHRYCVNREGGYECITRLPSCSRGFEYSLLTRQCEDVDECRSGRASCELRLSERCINLPGSYRCERPQPGIRAQKQRPACPVGYSYDVSQRKCSDIDECADQTHNCGSQKCYNSPGSFQCAKPTLPVLRKKTISTTPKISIESIHEDNCSIGTRYNEIRRGCVDINECEEIEDACSSNEVCKNTFGSFHCTCITGFRRDELTQACIDVNECQLENDCLASQRCDNTIGSYTCVRFLPCGTGYTLNAATEICEDDDECSLGTHDCIPGYYCRNTLGSYRCEKNRSRATSTQRPTTRRTKRPEFRITTASYNISRTTIPSTTTTSTTTSTTTTHKPVTTASISTTVPKITNATTQTTGTTVTPRNEVTTTFRSIIMSKPKIIITTTTEDIPTVGTLSTSTEIPKATKFISFRPKINCPRGFENGLLGQCIDIDECQRNFRICGGQRCVNSIGSYRCEPRKVCGIGYVADPISAQCKDINECVQGLHKCGPQQICENRQGGYICYCPIGYEVGSNHNCVDLDECERALPNHLCGDVGYCVNTVGSYHCECDPGFEVEPTGRGCRDVDECVAKPVPCQQECYNTWGGHRCGCSLGYRLRPDNRTCEDIDECSEFMGNSLCIGICDNVPGSYVCRCPDGYRLDDDGRTCQDIDECATGNVCKKQGELCHNNHGGFRCNKINCSPGYSNDLQRKNRCVPEKPFCPIHDQTCFQRPAHYTYNYISIVSMFPIPKATGQVELFTMRGTYNLVGSITTFSMAFISAHAPPHVQPATESCFALRKPFPSQAVLVMTRSLQGPQDIELEFSMEIYGPSGTFGGSAVAKIFIVVTQYEF